MKRIIALALAAIMVLALVGCAQKTEKKDRLDEIKARGYIEICTEPFFAPYEFVDVNKTGQDQYVGADIELAKYIADKIGVELRIVPLDFTAVLAGIVEGKYDLAISAIAWSPDRLEAMNLSKGYYFANDGYGFICRTEDKDKYTSIESVKDAVVITQSGSVQEAIYKQYVKKCKEFKRVQNMTDGYLAVAEKKADVCICSLKSAALYAEANGGLSITDFTFDIDPEMNAVVCGAPKKNTDKLIELVNGCIDEVKNDAFLKWFDEAAEYAATLGV